MVAARSSLSPKAATVLAALDPLLVTKPHVANLRPEKAILRFSLTRRSHSGPLAVRSTVLAVMNQLKGLREVVGAWRFELQTSCAQGRRLKLVNCCISSELIHFFQFTVVTFVVSDSVEASGIELVR